MDMNGNMHIQFSYHGEAFCNLQQGNLIHQKVIINLFHYILLVVRDNLFLHHYIQNIFHELLHKFSIYLFGKVIPALSLVLSMSLRFVPKFKSQMQTVTEAQRSIGRDVSNGSLFERTKTAIHIFSIMITWSLENAIETADIADQREAFDVAVAALKEYL